MSNPIALQTAAALVLKYVDANRMARNCYPDRLLPIEEAMKLLAEAVIKERQGELFAEPA